VYYALAEQDFTTVAVINPAHARALRGHKTGAKTAPGWRSCSSAGCCTVVHPGPGAEGGAGPDAVRIKTVQARTSEIQRLAKALESAGIKLGSVASDITGKSATAMIGALIDGERRGQVLADLRSAGCAPRGSWPTCPWR